MAENKDIHKGHRQRVWDRVAAEGLRSFNAHQVMEVLLFQSIPRMDVSETAHALIDRFGSVDAVLNADKEALMEVSGVGAGTANWLMLMGELVNSYAAIEPEDRPHIGNLSAAAAICEKYRKWVRPPQTYHICLTPAGMIQRIVLSAESAAWSEPETFRKGAASAVEVYAHSIIVVVYTGSEKPEFTEKDFKDAVEQSYTLNAMGIRLLDVIFVGSEEINSMQRCGGFDNALMHNSRGDSRLAENYLNEEKADLEDVWICDDDLI